MPYIRMKVTVTGTASDVWDRHIPGDYFYEVHAYCSEEQRRKDALAQFHNDIHVRVISDFDYAVSEAPYSPDPDEDEPHGSKTAAETLGGGCGLDEPEEGDEPEPEPMFWYLNVYLTDRAYGGPEEGGWWYSCGIPATDLPDVAVCYGPYAYSDKEAMRVQREVIKASLERHNNGRRSDLNSVCSEGRYIVCQEGHIAKHWPETRPTYE